MNWLQKLKLLVWKNFLLQKRHKYQTAFEILAPVLFSIILVLVRGLVDPDLVPAHTYEPFNPIILSTATAISNFTSENIANATVAFAPDTPLTRQVTEAGLKMVSDTNIPLIMADIFPSWVLNFMLPQLETPMGFKTAKEMEFYLTRPNAMKYFLAGIQFDDSMIGATEWPNDITFTIRFPAVMRRPVFDHPLQSSWRTNLLYPMFSKSEPRFPGDPYGGQAPGYATECFLAVQHAVSLQIIKSKTGHFVQEKVMLQRFSQLGFMTDNLDKVLEKFVSTIIMISFVFTFVSTVRMVTYEKELQLKETMTIMGLPSWLHWLAFFIKQISFLFISVLLMTILFKIPFKQTKGGQNLAVFTNTPWDVLSFFLLLYMIASICFAFLVSVFFNKANTAAAFMGLLWFTTYSWFLFTQVMYETLSLPRKIFLSLFSNTLMGFAFQMLVICEGSGGLQWKNFFKPITHHDSFLPIYVVIMFLVDAVLYMLLAMYIEKVFPGKFGVPLPWYFPFTKKFWIHEKKNVSGNSLSQSESELREPLSDVIHDEEPRDATVRVNVKNLTKIFKGKKKVVDNLNLRVYENEITVLLGHNGAGKTTTISMLTGLLPPTSGVAEINGYNIVTNTTAARKSLGICPQHNVLFPDLTVEEHIYFFSTLKGVPKATIKQDVDHYVRLLDLQEKRNVRSSKLSGGQMRRLSVGAAMCGNSKVVLLDEPTSGLDPAARRALWDLLQKEKQGRSIILTTHFMDEADVLGDRIAIMSAGKLQCIGTPYFLKKHYGVGYKLTIVKGDNCDVQNVTTFFKEYVPGIQENSDIGSELTYILPNEYVSRFPDMLKNLEDAKDGLGIVSYGLTITSLEEVFMKVGAEEDEEVANNSNETNRINGANVRYITVENQVVPLRNQSARDSTGPYQKETGSKLLRNHIKAMFIKLFYNTIRNKLTSLIQFSIPIIIVIISIIISRSWKFLINLPPLKLSLESGFGQTETLISYLNLDDEESVPAKAYKAMQDYFKETKYPGLTAQLIGRNNISEVYLKMNKEERSRISYENLVGATFEKDKITGWFSNYGMHDAAISLALINNALMRALSPGSSLNVINHPLPFAIDNLIIVSGSSRSFGFQFALYLGFCLAIVTAFLVIFPIKERVTGSKLLQRISGVRPLVYWGISFLWDWIWLTCIYLGIIIALACFQEQTVSTPAELGRIFLILLVFSLATIPIHYMASFVPRIPATGFAVMCFINIMMGAMPFMITEILRFPGLGNKTTAETFDYIFSPLPLYCVMRCIRDLCTTAFSYVLCEELCIEHYNHNNCSEILCNKLKFTACCLEENAYLNWAEPGVGRYIFTMLVVAAIFVAILLLKEFGIFNMIFHKIIKSPLPPSLNHKLMDDDVVTEDKNVHSLAQRELQERSLVVKDLTKYYKKFLAVNKLNFAVRRGECFGLLGVNGAGKTTTFKMLTGDSHISYGDAFVHGYSLKNNLQDVYRYIGYCPQFDALTDNLTAKETLRIYSLLRGIPTEVAAARAKHLASVLGFVRHFNKRVMQCSGGTKRKISTAVALLGDSPLIFLDEPTSGMDPASKRLVWNSVMEAARTGRSVVLTSHSMEECEALCSRLTIMVQGGLRCIGPTQHLKNKFSQGYSLMVKCKSGPQRDQTLEQVHAYVTTTFNAERVDTYLGISTFFIKDASLLWWELFAAMEDARDKYDIEDYAITQTTLEQVFLSFANRQPDEPRGVRI